MVELFPPELAKISLIGLSVTLNVNSSLQPLHLLFEMSSLGLCPQILAFILIRNIPGYARSIYSSFFAWFGKISLEVRPSWQYSCNNIIKCLLLCPPLKQGHSQRAP